MVSIAFLASCSSNDNDTTESDSSEIPSALTDNSWTVNEEDFITAVTFGNAEAVQYMLEQGIDPDTHDSVDRPAMYAAITMDNDDVVTLLIEYGADVAYTNEYGVNYIYFASINHQANPTIQALIDGGVDLYYELNGSNSLDVVLGQLNAYGETENGDWQRVADLLTSQGLTPAK